MEDKIYQVLKNHRLSLKKREEIMPDLLALFNAGSTVVKEQPDNFDYCWCMTVGEKKCKKQCTDCKKGN